MCKSNFFFISLHMYHSIVSCLGKDSASSFWKTTWGNASSTERQEEALPGHPWADVSSESWTSSESPAPPGWRPRPRPPGYRVWPPRNGRSGRWGCWETAPLWEKHRRSVSIKKKRKSAWKRKLLICRHVGQRAASSVLPLLLLPFVCSRTLLLQSCLICFIWSHCSPLQNNPSSGQKGNH